jgi:hypothetical protein
MDNEKKLKPTGGEAAKKRKPYQKPSIHSERVLDAGMGACNTSGGGRKKTTAAGCGSGKLVC